MNIQGVLNHSIALSVVAICGTLGAQSASKSNTQYFGIGNDTAGGEVRAYAAGFASKGWTASATGDVRLTGKLFNARATLGQSLTKSSCGTTSSWGMWNNDPYSQYRVVVASQTRHDDVHRGNNGEHAYPNRSWAPNLFPRDPGFTFVILGVPCGVKGNVGVSVRSGGFLGRSPLRARIGHDSEMAGTVRVIAWFAIVEVRFEGRILDTRMSGNIDSRADTYTPSVEGLMPLTFNGLRVRIRACIVGACKTLTEWSFGRKMSGDFLTRDAGESVASGTHDGDESNGRTTLTIR